ncbi:MAG: MSCRAMM family protein, partial [Sphingomonas sp.]
MTAWALPGFSPGGAFGFSAAAQAGAWQPDPEEQWLFDLRTDRFSLGQGIRGYARGDAVCVDLGDMIRALSLPIRINGELRRATGWAFDERRTLTIDREAGRVEVASAVRALAPGDIIDTPEGWCVAPAALAQWLGVELSADLSNSIIRLTSDTALPFERAAERRARAAQVRPQAMFNLAELPQRERPYAMFDAPSVDVIATAEVRRDADGSSEGRFRYELFASGEVLGASVDARLASDEQGVPASLRVSAYRSDPAGGLLGPLRATHVAAGDVSSLLTPIGLDSAIGRGAIITNHPLDRPAAFDRTQFRGDMPAGWEAELYRNGQLLAFAAPDASGRYEFLDVELVYGMNQFEIVLYGPQGQVRREVRTIPVGMDSIPSGQSHYWLGVIEEGVDLIPIGDPTGDPLRRGLRAVAAFERGLNLKTGIGVYATTRMYDGRRYSGAEIALRRALGATLLEASGGWQSGGGMAARLLWTGL